MEIVFAHPLAAVVLVAVALPLAAFVAVERRAGRLRRTLRLPPPRRRRTAPVALALGATAALLAAAAAGPVLLEGKPVRTRTDAEAYVVLDVTRSMLASARPGSPTRLDRARMAAARLREAVSDVPVGIASFTNRLVPHIFPTTDADVFASGLARSIGIERPPPDTAEGALVTALDALGPLQTHGFFSPAARRRAVVVLTDGETLPLSQATETALRGSPPLDLVVVRLWSPGERIHEPLLPLDSRYRTDPSSTPVFDELVRSIGARAFAEGDVDEAAALLRRRLGRGDAVVTGREVSARPLAAWAVALAAVPLAYVLRRRNL
jgi:hypothetical protein